MLAKVKPQVFLDTLNVELVDRTAQMLTAVLKDEKGGICRSVDYQSSDSSAFTLTGLNDLPYGVYSLELSRGEEQLNIRLVKRV
jgi:hypothetical protein